MSFKSLSSDFFNRPCDLVAQELIGKVLSFKEHQAYIIETEAYFGMEDPASHAYKGLTARNYPMFAQAGYTYIYLIYGMHYCLNISCDQEGVPSAVLIRGIYIDGIPINKLNGPGKLTRYLGITKQEHNYLNICREDSEIKIYNDHRYQGKLDIQKTPRVGISKGKEFLYRFIGNNF